MDLFLQDKIIIVTGGAKGIGAGIVSGLASEGAIPVIIGRNEDDNLAMVSQVEAKGGKAFQVVAELSDPEACRISVAKVAERFGRIDGVVNNAGVNDGVATPMLRLLLAASVAFSSSAALTNEARAALSAG